MNNERKYKLIEGHLAKTLAGEDLVEFEELLKSDSSIIDEINLHSELEETLAGEDFQGFRNSLKKVNKDWTAEKSDNIKPIRKNNYKNILMIAASVSLLAVVMFFFRNNKSVDNNTMYADNFSSYKMILGERNVNNELTNIDLIMNEAVEAYNEKDFILAAEKFEILAAEKSDVLAYSFYKAIAQMSSGKHAVAQTELKRIIAQPTHVLSEQAQWYLALSYLKSEKSELAITEFNKIEKDQFKFNETQNILKSLN